MSGDFTTYQLVIHISQRIHVLIGRLGKFYFPAGEYIYTGSAKRNMESRIGWHLRKEKKLRWHIDYLLANRHVQVMRVRRSRKDECPLNQSVGGTVTAFGFGASDCRSDCGSHLRYIGM